MADTLTTTKTLGIGFEYLDTEKNTQKTVYLKIPNPTNNLTEQQIKTAALNLISGEEPILKTPQENKFDTATAIATAYTENVEVVNFDIGVE